MEIKNIDINKLLPYGQNPRNNDGKAVEMVANSIKEFGFKVPIIVDKNNEIIAGHTRLKASQKLGLKKVPVIIADDLTPDQVKAFRLADNKVAEFSEWDFELLTSELANIKIDMGEFGFDDLFNEDDFNDEFDLPNNDGPIHKTMTFSLTQAQFDLVNDIMGEVELSKYDMEDNTNKNGNILTKVFREWKNGQEI